mgnify:CR=1 FL=1
MCVYIEKEKDLKDKTKRRKCCGYFSALGAQEGAGKGRK